MEFQDSSIGGVRVVKVLAERVTADVAARFKQGLVKYVEQGDRVIVLDLSEVAFIDSSGLGALIGSLKAMGSDGEMVLCGAQDTVMNMFKLTRMNKVFRMFGTPEEAAAAIG
jgi:anti-sigma B factor antagonist